MNTCTVILNDYSDNVKAFIAFDQNDVDKVYARWDEPDERLKNLAVLPSFVGYEKWSELTPEHYRILITRALNALASLSPEQRTDASSEPVGTANFIILSFIICLEKRTSSEIEHFRINRFDDLNVSFDYSGSFDLNYDRPKPRMLPPEDTDAGFSIIVDNSKD